MKKKIKIKTKALLFRIETIAFVSADIREGKEGAHRLHQVYDVCQEGNIGRVADIMCFTFLRGSEKIRRLLADNGASPLHHHGKPPEYFTLRIADGLTIDETTRHIIHDTMGEYIVASVLADWFGITLPEAADEWKKKEERLALILDSLNISSFSTGLRRKLWPF